MAGFGSGGALLGAVLAGFVAVGALVAFNDLPSSSASTGGETILVDTTNAPEAAAVAATGPAGAPGPTAPAAAAAVAALPVAAPLAPGSVPGLIRGGGPDRPDVPGPGPGPLPPPPPEPPAPTVGDLGNTVNQVNDTVEGATGIDLDLGGKTGGITGGLDEVIRGITGGRGLGLDQLELPRAP